MPRRTDIHRILIIGSGPIIIGYKFLRVLIIPAPRPNFTIC